jgi:hypothetical protein
MAGNMGNAEGNQVFKFARDGNGPTGQGATGLITIL